MHRLWRNGPLVLALSFFAGFGCNDAGDSAARNAQSQVQARSGASKGDKTDKPAQASQLDEYVLTVEGMT